MAVKGHQISTTMIDHLEMTKKPEIIIPPAENQENESDWLFNGLSSMNIIMDQTLIESNSND